MPRNAILSAEGAGTMDIGLTQLPSYNARSCLNAGTYGTMGVGLGQAIAACVVHPDRPVIHLSGDLAIGAFPAWRWRRWSATTCRPRSSS